MQEAPIRQSRRLIRYEDLNHQGTVFGGRLAMWIDEAAAIYSICQMKTKRIVTLRISELLFKHPIRLHDIIEFRCSTVNEGRTSLTALCQVIRLFEKEELELASAELVFVALDEQWKPTPWKRES